MNKAIDVATHETLTWVRGELGLGSKRILEVGCGRGEVAVGLVRDGHEVVAIDTDADCVAHARSLGVTAYVMEFPHTGAEIASKPFDVVLFARVLHHIGELSLACERAASLLAPGGKVVLEDFAWERVDEETAAWIFDLFCMGRTLGFVPDDAWNWDAEPMAFWREAFVEHKLHTGDAMLSALARQFVIGSTATAPYIYRWFAQYLEHRDGGYALTRAILDAEVDRIETAALVPVGLRAVATKASPTGQSAPGGER